MDIYLPIANMEFNVLILVAIGFCVGTLSGFFGVGGGWVITPALNIFGLPMPLAIGTSLVQTFGQSIIATMKHSRMGNVDWRLGLLSIVGSVAGVEIGKQAVLFLEKTGHAGSVIRWVYIGFLAILGSYILRDYIVTIRRERQPTPTQPTETPPTTGTPPVARNLRNLNIPPFVSLPNSGIPRMSFWVLFVIFGFAGFLSGFMGVGGGFILLPALIYLVGCPTTVAIGTSLLGVTFMAGYGSFSYSLIGRTELWAAVIMLLGASVGAQLGALATRYVQGYGIRLLFSIMLLLAGTSVLLMQGYEIFGIIGLHHAAGAVVLSAAGAMALLIIIRLLIGIRNVKRST